MKNFIWISPNFPVTYYHFAQSLKNKGVRVLGIGDADYDSLKSELKESLTEYYRVKNLDNFDQEIEAVRFFQNKYGHIDYLESNNEFWLEKDAKIREMFGISTGIYPKILDLYQHKSQMKVLYKKAGAKVAQYIIIDTLESAIKFSEKVGFPLFIKPDKGVGASESFKIKNLGDLKDFFNNKVDNVTYICEQYLSGYIVSFDGVTNSKSEPIFCCSHVFPPSVSDVKNEQLDLFYYCTSDVDKNLLEIGKRVIKVFNLKNRFFHSEYFCLDKDIDGVGKKGDFVGLEVNVRTPGGYTPDLINYANSIDCYQIYADSVIDDYTNFDLKKEKFIAACASRRNINNYFYSDEEILKTFHKNIVQHGEYPKVFSDIMGDRYFMARFNNLKEAEVFKLYVGKRKPEHIEKPSIKKNSSIVTNICDSHIDGA